MPLEPYYSEAGIQIFHGDYREVLPRIGPVDHFISDPPYSATSHEMHSNGKEFAQQIDGLKRADLQFTAIDGPYLAWALTVIEIRRWAVFTMDDRLAAWLRLNTPAGW